MRAIKINIQAQQKTCIESNQLLEENKQKTPKTQDNELGGRTSHMNSKINQNTRSQIGLRFDPQLQTTRNLKQTFFRMSGTYSSQGS